MSQFARYLFAVALLVVIGSALFLAFEKEPTRVPAPASTLAPSAAPSPTPSASPASMPPSYVNTKYGYGFSYPKEIALGDSQSPLVPVSATTDAVCATRPGSGSCSFSVKVVTASGPQTLTAEYVRATYPGYDPRYETVAQASFGIGLSGIKVMSGELRDFYVETPAGVVLDFYADTDSYGAAILDTATLTR